MQTIKIGNYDWYLIKEVADKTILFSAQKIVDGYFDDSSNKYETSKVNSFLNTVFKNSLKSPDFDVEKIVNGIWLLTPIQYLNYVKGNCPPPDSPFLLRTQGSSDEKIQCILTNEEVGEIGVKDKAGIRPGFMLDTEYVKTLLSNQSFNNVENKNEKRPEEKRPEEKRPPLVEEPPVVTSRTTEEPKTNKQTTAERIRVPVFNNQEENVPQINVSETKKEESPLENKNPIQKEEPRINNNSQQNNKNNNQNAQNNQNSQNNQKKNKNKKKKNKAKNKTIEIVKPKNNIPNNAPVDEFPVVNENDFDYLLDEISIPENNTAIQKDESNKMTPNAQEETLVVENVKENEVVHENKQEDILENKNNIIEDNYKVESELFDETKIDDADIVEIEPVKIQTPPVVKPPVPLEPVKVVSQNPFANASQRDGNKPKKLNRNNNETFNNMTQQNAKKGQNIIMSKLGAIDTPQEPERSEKESAIAIYTAGNQNTSIKKQGSPSTYSQEMSEINQFTVEQLKDIVIKRNKQITKLKVSLLEITAEHEALMEKISETKTESEALKNEKEKLVTEIETLKKEMHKAQTSVAEEKEELLEANSKAVAKLQKQVEEKTTEYNKLLSENQTTIQKIEALERELKEKETQLISERETLLKEIDNLKEKLQNVISGNNTSDETNKCLEEELEKIKIQLDELQKEKETLVSENRSLKEELSSREKSETATEPTTNEDVDLMTAKKKVIALEDEILIMKSDITKSLRIAKKLAEELTSEKEKTQNQAITIKSLTEKLNELQSTNESLSTDVKQFKALYESEHKKVLDAESETEKAKEEIGNLQGMIGSNSVIINNLNTEITDLKYSLSSLNKTLDKKTILIESLNAENKKKETEVATLTEKLRKAKEDTSEKDKLNKIIEALSEKIKILEEEAKEKDERIERLTNNINSDFDDFSDLKDILSKLS